MALSGVTSMQIYAPFSAVSVVLFKIQLLTMIQMQRWGFASFSEQQRIGYANYTYV
jgi:hypothetical protein